MSQADTTPRNGSFADAPAEIILEISIQLALVSSKGLASFRQTCRRFNALSTQYEQSIVKSIMAHYPEEELERLNLSLKAPTYPSMHKVVIRYATMSWIVRGITHSIKDCCKTEPYKALARIEEGVKLMYTVSDERSRDGKIEILHKMSIASLVSLWLALWYCKDEAHYQGAGIIGERDEDVDFQSTLMSSFCEEVLWRGPSFVYDTIMGVKTADRLLRNRVALVERNKKIESRLPLDHIGMKPGNDFVFDELEDWLSGGLGCESWELINVACFGWI